MRIFNFNLPSDCFLLYAGMYTSSSDEDFRFHVCWNVLSQKILLYVDVPGSIEPVRHIIAFVHNPCDFNRLDLIDNILQTKYNAIAIYW